MAEHMKKEGNKKIIIIILVLCIIAIAGGITAYLILNNSNQNNEPAKTEETPVVTEPVKKEEPPVEEKKVQIYKGNQRPIAVMIDNVEGAFPQAGLNDAYMVYEIIVEGGQTRLMALFKGVNLDLIGPVRSSRHYFLDYALENDAIYTHFGWSPKAQSDISTLGVNNVNGLVTGTGVFWRSNEKYAPHNAVISTKNILQQAKNYGYRTKSDEESVLNYVTEEVELEDGKKANTVVIPYSYSHTVTYKYDKETGRYTRDLGSGIQQDWTTGKQVTTKNIIITFASNYSLNDGSGKGRQDLNNIGKLDGYYITNGKAIKITCEKKSRTAKTIYKDLKGKEIEVNDGNTFVQICPINANVTIK